MMGLEEEKLACCMGQVLKILEKEQKHTQMTFDFVMNTGVLVCP